MVSDLLTWLGITDPDIQKTALPGLLGLLGVMLTAAVGILVWWGNQIAQRIAVLRERRQRKRDVRTALLAEIQAIWWQLSADSDFATAADGARARFEAARAAGEDYTPFVTAETGAFVLDALVEDISMLDADIRPIVMFYRQIKLLEQMSADMKTQQYAGLDLDRKEAVLLDYLRMTERAERLARDACGTLAAALGVALEAPPPDATPRRPDAVSRREPGPIPPEPASPAAERRVSGHSNDEA